ncbi:MAG: hypothetical protein Q4F66_09370 [Clostridium sp.]|nr:hypothetical protein [Clostridium sp.]
MKDISNNLVGITPPWYTLANKIKYTYGLSDLVQVNDLIDICNQYVLVINVFDNLVAQSLRQVLPETVVMGNIIINIVIFNNNGAEMTISNEEYTPETLSGLFNTALTGNPLFKNVVITDGLLTDAISDLVGDVVVVIDKAVVQFYNDDISELCSNFNEVASKVFAAITTENYEGDLKVGFSTYDPDCQLQN